MIQIVKNSTAKQIAFFAGVASLSMLLGAFGFQYLGGMAPCHLCLLERYPHAFAFALGAVAFFFGNRWVYLLGAFIMLYSASLAGYHTGVEQHWWLGPTTCTSQSTAGMSPDELFAHIMQAPLVRCDEIPWSMFGLSMAAWNGVMSLGYAAIWLVAFRRA